MNARTVPEWIAPTPDTAIPPRVRIRIWDRANGHCTICTRKIRAGEAWQADHTVALINGGENREQNLRLVCGFCHKSKTAEDVAEKAKTARVRKRHLGIKAPSRFACSRDSTRRKKVSGEVVDRLTGEPIGRK